MKDTHEIRLTVNGREHELAVEARRTLADMLRHDLGYTGTHLGCEHGICGACTVILDDLMLAEAYLAEDAEHAEDAAPLTEEQARELVASNLCRCTGYQGIVEAVRATAQARRKR